MSEPDFGENLKAADVALSLQTELDKIQKPYEKQKSFLSMLLTISDKNAALQMKLTEAEQELCCLVSEAWTGCEHVYSSDYSKLLRDELDRMVEAEKKQQEKKPS
jgi:hypothetical protein